MLQITLHALSSLSLCVVAMYRAAPIPDAHVRRRQLQWSTLAAAMLLLALAAAHS